jgi:hypothetical protein
MFVREGRNEPGERRVCTMWHWQAEGRGRGRSVSLCVNWPWEPGWMYDRGAV